MKEKFQRFMMGRYGVDDLSRFLLYVLVGLMVLNFIFRNALISLLLIAGLAVIYVRMFSRNHSKRYEENARFLRLKDKVLGRFRQEKNLAAQRKVYHIYTCPGCKQKIRVPRGKGKIEVTCPKCHTSFIKKS